MNTQGMGLRSTQPFNCLLWIIMDADKERWGRENRPHRSQIKTVNLLQKETINTVGNPDGIDGSHRKTVTPKQGTVFWNKTYLGSVAIIVMG